MSSHKQSWITARLEEDHCKRDLRQTQVTPMIKSDFLSPRKTALFAALAAALFASLIQLPFLQVGGMSLAQGGAGEARPKPKPKRKRKPINPAKPSGVRPRSMAPVSNANSNAAPKPTAAAPGNSNNSNNTETVAAVTPIPPNPDADILLHQCSDSGAIDVGEHWIERKWPFEQRGTFSEISEKRKVFANKTVDRLGEETTTILRKYGGLEIVETAKEAEFALNYCSWYFTKKKGADDTVFPLRSSEKTLERGSGGTLVITVRDPLQRVPRVIWQAEEEDAYDENPLFQSKWRLPDKYAFEKLTKRFINELKKLRGEKADIEMEDILLPQDFRYFQQSKPGKRWNTDGTFPEISDKRRVFVNVRGEAGEKITARLREYGRLEIVQTTEKAEFAIHYYPFVGGQYVFMGQANTVTGGGLIITIPDPLQHIPRVIWRHDDNDGGWLKKGTAYDKLVKRFISDLKKLRGEK
jgi:hypothetical protein